MATNIGETKDNVYDPTVSATIAVIASKVQIIDDSTEDTQNEVENRVFLVCPTACHNCYAKLMTMQSASRVQCHIGFGELAISLPDAHVASTVPVLVDMLQDIPSIDFDRTLSWEGASKMQSLYHPLT